jgi:glyoxylase-like metal-dependent hydrolase (beta-lactamase superfamily II)
LSAANRITAGDFRITCVRAGTYWWDGGSLFGVVPRSLWSKRHPPDELNRIEAAFNCYIIETGKQTILFDTGGGDKFDERYYERARMRRPFQTLPESIAAAGIDPERIDIVVNTHLHWDHCGWNTIRRGDMWEPSFPRAVYVTQRAEWEHAHERHVRDSVSYIDANYDPLVDSGRMQLIEGDKDLVPGIRLIRTPGHNRDMMCVVAQSAGATFAFLADMVPTATHVSPTWVAAFDLYPVQSIDLKLEWVPRAAREGWICGFSHEMELPFARINESNGKFAASAP